MRRNRFTRRPHKINSDINLTNLIDVTMTTLICYIILAPLVEQGIDVSLPQASPHKLEQSENVSVTVSKDGSIYLGQKVVTLSQLIDQLSQKMKQKPDAGVIIKADKNINYGKVINVLDELNNAGITKVGMATQTEETKPR